MEVHLSFWRLKKARMGICVGFLLFSIKIGQPLGEEWISRAAGTPV